MIIWSDLVYRCNDHVPEAVYLELPPHIQRNVELGRATRWERRLEYSGQRGEGDEL